MVAEPGERMFSPGDVRRVQCRGAVVDLKATETIAAVSGNRSGGKGNRNNEALDVAGN